jgi:hypothetical protein
MENLTGAGRHCKDEGNASSMHLEKFFVEQEG